MCAVPSAVCARLEGWARLGAGQMSRPHTAAGGLRHGHAGLRLESMWPAGCGLGGGREGGRCRAVGAGLRLIPEGPGARTGEHAASVPQQPGGVSLNESLTGPFLLGPHHGPQCPQVEAPAGIGTGSPLVPSAWGVLCIPQNQTDAPHPLPGRERERQRETERQRQRKRQGQREWGTARPHPVMVWSHTHSSRPGGLA